MDFTDVLLEVYASATLVAAIWALKGLLVRMGQFVAVQVGTSLEGFATNFTLKGPFACS